jgi:Major Facilitator Superfamily
VVSLAADMVYEGARSVTGPLLASIGASAVLVGLISGAGEATALLMRLVFGSWADRSRRYWTAKTALLAHAASAVGLGRGFGVAVPVLAFAPSALVAVAGALLWGAAAGVLDSTVKALVADLVPAPRRATAYGVFAAVQGAAAVGGGVMAGALYERSLPILIAAVIATQIVGLALLIATLHRHRKTRMPALQL